MILYIILGIICFLIIIKGIIKFKYNFWYYQPVFHSYDIFYYFSPPKIINREKPIKNKFCDLIKIHTYNSNEITNYTWQKYIRFIQKYSAKNIKNIDIFPDYNSVFSNFHNHNLNCYISQYTEDQFLFDYHKKSTTHHKNILGLITSRPLYITSDGSSFISYYIDFLCTKQSNKFKYENMIWELFQTHIYNQLHENNKYNTFIFTFSKQLEGIRPLSKYHTYCFQLYPVNEKKNSAIIHQENNIYSHLNICKIHLENIHLFLFHIKNNHFKITLTTYISNLYELIKNNTIEIYQLQNADQTMAIYIFKNNGYKYNHKNSIHCIGSMMIINDMNSFLYGFQLSCDKIQMTNDFLLLNNISDNYHIIQYLKKTTKPLLDIPVYMYIWNFIHNTVKSSKMFLLF